MINASGKTELCNSKAVGKNTLGKSDDSNVENLWSIFDQINLENVLWKGRIDDYK